MKACLVAVAVLLGAVSATAGSQPVVTGKVEGLETCAQSSCGVAQFLGTSQLQVGTSQTKGGFLVQVTHGALPAPGGTAPVTGGQWALSADQTIFTGAVQGGSLFNNGNNTFTVTLTLSMAAGGTGTLSFTGILDHNTFPPTIVGIASIARGAASHPRAVAGFHLTWCDRPNSGSPGTKIPGAGSDVGASGIAAKRRAHRVGRSAPRDAPTPDCDVHRSS